MAILCPDYDLLFAHVPRSGGLFVEHMLLEHLGGERIGRQHDTFRRLDLRRRSLIRVFTVRDPLAWYQSYWAFARHVAKRDSVWPTWDDGSRAHPTAELDRSCGRPDFEQFIRASLATFPNGFVRSMYCDYLNSATHVMRTSHLADDLEAVLRLVEFDRPSLVRDRDRVNEGETALKSRAVLPPEVEERILRVDNLQGLEFPYILADGRPTITP
jgi:hypothetical protein